MKKAGRKRRLKQFFVAKEVIMVVLALLCLVGLALEHLERLSAGWLLALDWFELAVGAIFLVEFAIELYFSKNRKKYWQHHWYFLLASVPVPLQVFDVLRSLRILRLLRLFKVFAHLRYERNTWLFEMRRP